MFRRCVAFSLNNSVCSRLFSRSAILNVVNPRNPGGPVLASRVQGVVKWFDAIKGFGFIQRNDNQQDVFVHLTAITGKNPAHQTRTLADGEPVEFDVIQGKAGMEAIAVTGPGGAPVQGNPMGVQTRRQMQNAVGGGFPGAVGAGAPSYSGGQNYYGGLAAPSFGAAAGFGGAAGMGGGFNPPPQQGSYGGPTPGGFGNPNDFGSNMPGPGGYGGAGGFGGPQGGNF